MNRHVSKALIALLLLLPLIVAFAQDDAGVSLNIIGIDPTDLADVSINAAVLDPSGRLVSGLDAANFSVGGDLAGLAEITRVANITDDELNFASVLVIDTSSSMAGRPLAELKEAARIYIEALGSDDPVAIVSFGSRVKSVVGYTTDRETLLTELGNLAYGGQTALYDATFRGIELAQEAPTPRKVVVILSDGGEYGDVSGHTRDESIRAATIHGVPVYAVGLGWDIDRRFLEAISTESNAEFYDLPTPEELGGIYRDLAFLFRSQYIVTISADVPADGKRYDFTLNVITADGQVASGSATLRAPIPTPLLFLPDDLFTDAIREDTVITVEIRADQDIASIEYAVDGEVVSTEETFTIEPETQQPGEHQLDITVSDVEGDTGRLSAEFEVAALPPTVSDDFEAADQEDIAQAEVISVAAGGQTEITEVEFILDGQVIATDNQAPYEFDLDPFELLPQEHTLSIRATNAGGQTTTVDKAFEVETLPPRLNIQGLTEETVVTDTLIGSVTALGQSPIASLSLEPDVGAVVAGNQLSFTLNAADLPPGRNTFAVRAVDEAGAETVQTLEFEVAALPPTVALSGVAVEAVIDGPRPIEVQAGGQTEITRIEVAYNGGPPQVVEQQQFTIPAEQLGDGDHQAQVTVTNAGGESTSLILPFSIELPPTPTFTPMPTDTATATSTATDTHTPPPTATITETPPHTATPDSDEATATGEAIATLTATALPSATELPTETSIPSATDTAIPTDTSTPVPTDTAIPTDTSTPVPTDTAIPTDTSTPLPTDTVTPVPTDTDTPIPTDTSTPIPTDTSTPIPTDTSTPIPTDTSTPIPTDTDTPIPTDTDTPVPTDTVTPIPTDTSTPVPTDTDTPVPTDTDTPVPTDTSTPIPTDTSTPVPTDTDTPIPTDTDTPIPTDTDTPIPTDTDTPVPTDTDTPIPTDTDTPVPTDTDTPIPTDTNTPIPTDTDTPIPTDTDTPIPTDTHTPVPTDTDTPIPTDTDTPIPTDTDTPIPTDTDTPIPTDTDTPIPTDTDTPIPTDTDTPIPTDTDTPIPTDTDTPIPTDTDTPIPTDTDTPIPTDTNTPVPTHTDTPIPTHTDTATATPTDTPDITATSDAESTLTAVLRSTLDAEATAEAEAERATSEAEATTVPSDQPTDVVAAETEAPTDEALDEPTAQPTLTPVTITEIEAPAADEPETRDTAVAIGAVVIGLLLLLILFLVSRRRSA